MKKIVLLASIVFLSSCINAGSSNILPQRNSFFTRMNSYGVDLYNNKPKLISSEYIEEKNFKPNVVLTAYKGYSVINNKTYKKDVYASKYIMPERTVVLSSATIPSIFKERQKIDVLGEVYIDNNKYLVIPTEMSDFYAFIDSKGELWNRVGELVDGDRIVLVDTIFMPNPDAVKFISVQTTRSEQSIPTKGFDIKYDGIRLDRIWFTFLDYNSSAGERGEFENISFPNKPGLIDVNGMGFRVLAADNDKIDYIVLK